MTMEEEEVANRDFVFKGWELAEVCSSVFYGEKINLFCLDALPPMRIVDDL